MTEIWKAIAGYEGLYEVSNLGRVRSLWFGKTKILKPRALRNGYLHVVLCKEGTRKDMLVHRLVAEAFVPNPMNKPEVNHVDENKTNNAASNIEWCTRRENNNWGTRNERAAEANVNNPKLSKPVQQFDKQTGVLLATFPSTREAARRTGIAQSSIWECCLGKLRTTGGFRWMYV